MYFYLWRFFYIAFFLILIGVCYEKMRIRRLSPPIVGIFMIGALVITMRSEFHSLFSFQDPTALLGMYVGQAYRTDDDEIRFYFFQEMENTNELLFDDGGTWRPILMRCICPMTTILSQCTVEGHLGVASFSRTRHVMPTLRLRTRFTVTPYDIPVVDVRIRADYPHQLGVCLQPVYFHADWPAYAQYIEFWLATGATKFYLYVHSATPKVRWLLSRYEAVLGDSLEIIEWSDLPVQERYRGNFYADPNTRIFSAGGHTALNDCILRARSHVKFLAIVDLDELLHVPSGRKALDVLNQLTLRYPEAGSFAFEWQYVQQETNMKVVRRPSDVSFSSLSRLKRPVSTTIVDDYVRLKKMIHRPERVIMSDVHNTIFNDLLDRYSRMRDIRFDTACAVRPDGVAYREERFSEVYVEDGLATVLHLRRFDALSNIKVPYNTSSQFDDLQAVAGEMESMWKKRIASGQIENRKMGNWYPAFEQTVRDLESCRQVAFPTVYPFNVRLPVGKGFCRALVNCEPMLTVKEAYVKSDQTWTNVAHRGKFISYITPS